MGTPSCLFVCSNHPDIFYRSIKFWGHTLLRRFCRIFFSFKVVYSKPSPDSWLVAFLESLSVFRHTFDSEYPRIHVLSSWFSLLPVPLRFGICILYDFTFHFRLLLHVPFNAGPFCFSRRKFHVRNNLYFQWVFHGACLCRTSHFCADIYLDPAYLSLSIQIYPIDGF